MNQENIQQGLLTTPLEINMDLRFSTAEWNKNSFDLLKRAFYQHPCRRVLWNCQTLNKNNAIKFLRDHEPCATVMYGQEGDRPDTNLYLACQASRECRNGLNYGLEMRRAQLGPADLTDHERSQLPESEPGENPHRLSNQDFGMGDNQTPTEQILRQILGAIDNQSAEIRTITETQAEQARAITALQQAGNLRGNNRAGSVNENRRNARDRRERQTEYERSERNTFNPPNNPRLQMPRLQRPEFPQPNWQFPRQNQPHFPNQQRFQNRRSDDDSDESSIICIGEVRAPGGRRQRHMSAEAEHALRSLQGEARSRNRESAEHNGEIYYESVVEASSSDEEDVLRRRYGSPYTIQDLYEHKCSESVRNSGNKDLSYTRRESKFDHLHFEKWSKTKHANLWNFLSNIYKIF